MNKLQTALSIFLAGVAAAAFAEVDVELAAELASEQVGPFPADVEGEGTATLRLIPDESRLCYALVVEDIQPATMAHLHTAEAGRVGPVQAEFDPPADGTSDGCVKMNAEVLRAIAANPIAFYVDVHNAEYPQGALRGQLAMEPAL